MIDAASLDRRLEEMRCALVAAPNEVSASLVIPARQGMDNVAKRLALGVDHTVAASIINSLQTIRRVSAHWSSVRAWIIIGYEVIYRRRGIALYI